MSVINYLKAADALTVMPHSVVFALRKKNPSPPSPDDPASGASAGNSHARGLRRSPAVDQFAQHIRSGFESLRHLIKRHEEAVVWGRYAPLPPW